MSRRKKKPPSCTICKSPMVVSEGTLHAPPPVLALPKRPEQWGTYVSHQCWSFDASDFGELSPLILEYRLCEKHDKDEKLGMNGYVLPRLMKMAEKTMIARGELPGDTSDATTRQK